MSSSAEAQHAVPVSSIGADIEITETSSTPYVALIQAEMNLRRSGIRALSLSTGISRGRLGRILHRDPRKRHPMTLIEFQGLTRALQIDPIEAVVTVELMNYPDRISDARFKHLPRMITCFLRGLPERIFAALHENDSMDGSEIRSEWGLYFQKAVVSRMVQEVDSILERRARLASNSDPFAL